MPERRTKRRTSRQPDQTKVTDDRLQHGSQPPAGPGPSPYDVAPPGMPEDRVIRKGKPEPPGPTEPADSGGDDQSDQDVDRGARTTMGGNALGGGDLRDDVEESLRQGDAATGDLGGEDLHRRVNNEHRDRRGDEVEP